MKTISFVSGGKLGDFIHTLSVVKNICLKENCLANLYLSEGRGDIWTFGAENAFNDLHDLVSTQPYINSFSTEPSDLNESFIDLNRWRTVVAEIHAETGVYNACWSNLLSCVYDFSIPDSYAWIQTGNKAEFRDKIVIHQSLRHYCGLPWDEIFEIPCKGRVFVTSNIEEWNNFKHKDGVSLCLVNSVKEMAVAINSGKLFVGNQSAPFAIASALDVPRIVGLDPDPAPFYMGEERYSDNIMWYLNDKTKYMRL